jgi:pilus assembly protein TadC
MLALLAESNTGWVIGYVIGIVVVLAVVALVLPILLLARSIGGQAERIDAGLGDAVRHTASLSELNTTIASAEVIVDGLRRGRQRLVG